MQVTIALFAVIVVVWAVLRWRRKRQQRDTVDESVLYYRQIAAVSDDPAMRRFAERMEQFAQKHGLPGTSLHRAAKRAGLKARAKMDTIKEAAREEGLHDVIAEIEAEEEKARRELDQMDEH